MRIAVTGSSGLIGSALVPAAEEAGHEVLRLIRREPRGAGEIRWNPGAGELDPGVLADVDAVVNLAGVGIGDKRWTDSYKRQVADSRVSSTRAVSTALAEAFQHDGRPRVLLSASAIGFYGDTGDRVVTEDDPAGGGFLAEVCQQWEAAAAPAVRAEVRTAFLRTGLVLARKGGMMGRITPLFKLGVGGKLGSGKQWWSWISLADEVGAILHLLTADVAGPVNLVGPAPVTNAEFTRAMGRAVSRPAVLPVPGIALKAVLGGFAEEGVLAGQRVRDGVLESIGYEFRHATLDAALDYAVKG